MEYQVPEYVGRTPEICGIDYFILHYACWTNRYSKRLRKAGIFEESEEIELPDQDIADNNAPLTIPYGANYHIQIFNPSASFSDAVDFISCVAYSEEKFRAGEVIENPINFKGSEEIVSFMGLATSDTALVKACGYKTDNEQVIDKMVKAINRISKMSIQYRVKPDPKFNNDKDLVGCRQTKKGKILESRTIRFINTYVRSKIGGKGNKNLLVLDSDFIKRCHSINHIVQYKKLHKLRNNETALGIYLYWLGNQPEEGECSRFFPIQWFEKYFQIILPKKPTSKKPIDIELYEVQMKFYKEVQTDFRDNMRQALNKLKELGYISGWKSNGKKDRRAKTEYVDLKKSTGLMIWK